MKLLKISALGLPLFKGKCEIDFLAQQRVSSDNADKMGAYFLMVHNAFIRTMLFLL